MMSQWATLATQPCFGLSDWRKRLASSKRERKISREESMNRVVAQWLIDQDIFESVMTAMRGPDNEDPEFKHWLTGPLRGAVGFHYGSVSLPFPVTVDLASGAEFGIGSVGRKLDGPGARHFFEHTRGALLALRRAGYELSRIPLPVYLDPVASQEGYGRNLRDRILETMGTKDRLAFGNLIHRLGLDIENAPFRRINL